MAGPKEAPLGHTQSEGGGQGILKYRLESHTAEGQSQVECGGFNIRTPAY